MMHKRGYQRRIASLLRPALWLAAITSVSVLAPPKAVSAVDQPFLTGVNLAGAGFGSERIVKGGGRGRHGIDYVYPVEPFAPGYTSPSYFVSNGMNAFRLSFLWERLQPKLGGSAG